MKRGEVWAWLYTLLAIFTVCLAVGVLLHEAGVR